MVVFKWVNNSTEKGYEIETRPQKKLGIASGRNGKGGSQKRLSLRTGNDNEIRSF